MSEEFNNHDELETGLKVLSFCIPLAGAILYFVNKDKAPVKAKQACNMALIGVGVGIVLNVVSMLITGSMSQ